MLLWSPAAISSSQTEEQRLPEQVMNCHHRTPGLRLVNDTSKVI